MLISTTLPLKRKVFRTSVTKCMLMGACWILLVDLLYLLSVKSLLGNGTI